MIGVGLNLNRHDVEHPLSPRRRSIRQNASSHKTARPFVCLFISLMLLAVPIFAQHERGEIHLYVRDSQGGPLEATVELASEMNQVQRSFSTAQDGHYVARELPLGVYRLRVSHRGFASTDRLVDVRSEVPLTVSVTLGLAPVQSRIEVTDSATLIDPNRTGTIYAVGSEALNEQMPAQMSRSVTDAVDTEPGWLYEANGVLHPRGSEYDVQFVVNGLPLTENRSPAFAPPLESSDVESMRVMTAGFPAEYGRKLGGVVELTTFKDLASGLHLTADAEGGSFETLAGDVGIGYARGKNQLLIGGSGGFTHRYLDPPVIPNFTNRGSTAGFTAGYSRDLTDRDRLRVSFRHDEFRRLVPNELVQQEAGQRQDAASTETSAQADYERVLTPTLLLSAEGSIRDESFRLWSNPLATPVITSQQRGLTQGYGRVTLAGSEGIQDWKLGVDAIFNPVHESLQYAITNPSLFDPGTALRFDFADRRTDVEPAAFAQDTFHWRNWNVSLGLRYDHYRFVVNQSAWSPRAAVSHYFARAGVLVHAAYDRVFQTPATENLLLASSPELEQVSPLVLRLPVSPARANYYEVGVTKGFWGQLRLDVNLFRRDFRNYSDDDTLLNTGVSFPIADASARIQGVEGKLTLPRWGRFSGSLSYSNQAGIAQGPVTGGLLIGSEAVAGVLDNSRFPVSQDQRNTAHARLRFEVTKRLWLATESSYGSGLPVELDTGDTDYAFLLAQYGPQILNQVDFARGRVRPSYSIDAGAGLDLYNKESKKLSLQIQASNLTNHLNLINFDSLFSGTALAAPRSFGMRLKMGF
jgi:TonB dependent receptor-like, beta-barrel/Carboxypeptidase regulatory-like domain